MKKLNLIWIITILLIPLAYASGNAIKGETVSVADNLLCNVQNNQDCWQSFHCGQTGLLTNITMRVQRTATAPTAITSMLIYNVSPSTHVPTTQVASWTAVPISFPSTSFTTFNFSGGVNCTKGKNISFVLHSANANGAQHQFSGPGSNVYTNGTKGYADGSLGGFTVQTQEFIFETWFNSTDHPDFAPISNTCTYSGSGDHNILCSDNCVLSSQETGQAGKTFRIYGSGGTYKANAYVLGYSAFKFSATNCNIIFNKGYKTGT